MKLSLLSLTVAALAFPAMLLSVSANATPVKLIPGPGAQVLAEQSNDSDKNGFGLLVQSPTYIDVHCVMRLPVNPPIITMDYVSAVSGAVIFQGNISYPYGSPYGAQACILIARQSCFLAANNGITNVHVRFYGGLVSNGPKGSSCKAVAGA